MRQNKLIKLSEMSYLFIKNAKENSHELYLEDNKSKNIK